MQRREEREWIEELTSPNFATFSSSSIGAEDGVDIMALWDAEDDKINGGCKTLFTTKLWNYESKDS
jgi:hypothetical protein